MNVPQKVKSGGGEAEAEERKCVIAGQVERENTKHDPMEEVVESECFQAEKQLQTAPKAKTKTTIPRPTGKQHKNPNARTQNPNA